MRAQSFLIRVVAVLALIGLVPVGSAVAQPSSPAAATTVTIGDIDLDRGPGIVDVPVTVTNPSASSMRSVTVTFRGPTGWQSVPGSIDVRSIRAKASATVTFQLRLPEPRPGFQLRTFTATATYRGGDGAGTAIGTRVIQSGEPLANLAAAYNNIGITSETETATGDFDGDGNSFSAEKLAAAGLGRGATVTALGASLTMPDVAPGTKDNAAAGGQAITLAGQGSKVVFLGSGSNLGAAGAATVYYTDGTTTSGAIGFPNWSFQAPDTHGATLVASTQGRNRPDGYGDAAYAYRVFAHAVPIDPAKTVDFVVLPGVGSLHVLSIAIAP